MRSWTNHAKQSLRLLSAARYFLPARLEGCLELEQDYHAHLYQNAFSAALAVLEQLGDLHSGHENEMHFWKELFYVARHMELPDCAARYEERVRQVVEMQRLQF